MSHATVGNSGNFIWPISNTMSNNIDWVELQKLCNQSTTITTTTTAPIQSLNYVPYDNYARPYGHGIARLFELYLKGVDLEKGIDEYLEALRAMDGIGTSQLELFAALDRFKKLIRYEPKTK